MAASIKSSPNIVTKETAKLIWTVDELSAVDDDGLLNSPQFSPPNQSANKFQIGLCVLPNSKMTSFVLIYNGHKEKKVAFYYHHSLLDADDREHFVRENRWNYTGQSVCNRNSTNYISINQLNKLEVNAKLRIYCEVDIFEKYSQFESLGKLSESYEALLQSAKLSNFVVAIGDKQFSVHKAILAARSEVFAAMFEHEQTKEGKEGRMVIEDVTVDAFELVIRYIYTGKVDELDEHADELLVAADKYQLNHLKSICELSLVTSLTVESVCSVLLLSEIHNALQLKSKCTEYILKRAKEVMRTDGWKRLLKSNLTDLVGQLFEMLAISTILVDV